MSNDELIIFIEAQIKSLSQYTDNTDYIRGYISALIDTLEKIKG